MHNIHELEKRWLNYKIKSFIPHVSFLLISILSLIVFLNIDIDFPSSSTTTSKHIEVAKTDIIKIEVKKQNKIALVKTEPLILEERIILTPSLDFIKKLRHDSTNTYKSTTPKEIKKQTIQEPVQNYTTDLETKKVKISAKKIKILKQETQADIEHVIKRFVDNNNPALSLFIAKKYYRLGEYDKAYNYALITNKLNNKIDESWIVFSKSLVKLNKKDKAIKVLKKYIKYSHSLNAKILLNDIISGQFR